MDKINSIRFINALAEITTHDDRAIIERSLMQTLAEYHAAKEYWLYQVFCVDPVLTLGLLAHYSASGIVISQQAVRQEPADHLSPYIMAAIQGAEITCMQPPKPGGDAFIVYPAMDKSGDVFAVLIECTKRDNPDSRRLVHGFLRIYANYLRLIEQTRRDKLTGLLNRETLEQEITRIIILNNESIYPALPGGTQALDEARQHKVDLTYWLGVLDIDHFKKINDSFGHLYGDEILILVARLMETCMRNYDLVFRFGGEEFVVLVKAADQADARQVFERIRMTVGQHDYAKAERVTISIGVVRVHSQMGAPEVIEQADQALYYAKEHGRNQVQFYAELIQQDKLVAKEQNLESEDLSFF